MTRIFFPAVVVGLALAAAPVNSQVADDFVPVTDVMLKHPDAADWLMYSRTYDAQRFSPLDQINRDSVADLTRAWTKPLPAGVIEIIPIVYNVGGNGAMLTTAGGLLFWGDLMQVFHAFDAATGEELWRSEPLGSTIMTSTITYAVDGRQYVAVINTNSALGPRAMAEWGGFELPEDRGNAINVFALPD